MLNSHGRKPLYEAIRDAQAKSVADKALERLHPEPEAEPKVEAVPEPVVEIEVQELPKSVSSWPAKPRFVQFNGGRLEFSLPYQLLIVLFLTTVAALMVVFRLGQYSPVQKNAKEGISVFEKTEETKPAAKPVVIIETKKSQQQVKSSVVSENAPVSKGSNRIVIQACQETKDLEPVKKYFAENGIGTEIRKIGSWYYLITADKYDNPEKAGTEGFAAKQKIKELGAKYQSPAGYGSFGPRPFSDAYGMKLD